MKNNKFVLAGVIALFASFAFESLGVAKQKKSSEKKMFAKEVIYECKIGTTLLAVKDEANCSHQGGKWEEKKAH